MTKLPTVDVIILSWDRLPQTIEALESALAQKDVDLQVQIVDQGSKPENLERLRAFVAAHPRVELREMEQNTGVAGGRNIASDMGEGDYIVALDNDAVFADERVLARTVATFESDPWLGALAFRIFNFYTGKDDEMCWDYPEALRPYADREFEVTRYIGAGHALRRDVFYEAGCYDESLFFAGEERDLAYRILNLGHRIRYVPHLAVLHKVQPDRRVDWSKNRYYYSVRNNIYSDYKFGRGPFALARSTTAQLVKGAYNGMIGQTLRAIWDAARMALEFRREYPDCKVYHLSREARLYIRSCEDIGRGGLISSIRRQFQRLPGRA
jgi:GT2 family glycosyltransferase